MSRHEEPIRSLDDWRRLGGPASKKHWKPGRSAFELASDWIDDDAEAAVVRLLGTRSEFAGLELLEGVVEKKTYFDDQPRGPRNHDLLVRGRSPMGRVTIGIEGKADEPFDDPLWLYREKALKRSSETGALRRVDDLVRRWFGTSLRDDRLEPPLVVLGYQLFAALAGTLVDAKTDGSVLAVVLVHEYVTDLTDDATHARNALMLEHFLNRLLGQDFERTRAPGGWVTAPRPIAGDGVRSANRTNVAFAKLTRFRRAGSTSAQ